MGVSFTVSNGYIFASFREQVKGKKTNLKYYTGIKLSEGEKLIHKRTRNADTNKNLSDIEYAIIKLSEEVNFQEINSKLFAQLIDSKLSGNKCVNNTNFYNYCTRFHSDMLNKKGKERAKHIQKVINKLELYDKSLTFDNINRSFYIKFTAWLEKKGYSANYIGSIIKDIRRIMEYATDSGANDNLEFRSFKKISEEVYNIYLNEEEVETIYHLNITESDLRQLSKGKRKRRADNISSKIEALNRARDLFVIGCWTGLRVENYLSIDPDIQIDKENRLLHVIANKNGPKLKIPLHRIVLEIIENRGLPKPISQQKLNEHIKELGQLAGIDETIIYTRTIGGKRKQFANKKYELITSHTARRSFASNMEIRGIPRQYTMAITGHKSEKSFLKYIQAVQKDILTEKMKEFDVWGQ